MKRLSVRNIKQEEAEMCVHLREAWRRRRCEVRWCYGVSTCRHCPLEDIFVLTLASCDSEHWSQHAETMWGCRDVKCSWLDATLQTVCVCVWVKYTLLLAANVTLSVWLTTLSMAQGCFASVLREPSNSDCSSRAFTHRIWKPLRALRDFKEQRWLASMEKFWKLI